MKSLSVTSQLKSTKQYFPVVLFVSVPYKAFLSFRLVNETLKCDHSNGSY